MIRWWHLFCNTIDFGAAFAGKKGWEYGREKDSREKETWRTDLGILSKPQCTGGTGEVVSGWDTSG